MKGTERPAEATHPLELFESYIDHSRFNHCCIFPACSPHPSTHANTHLPRFRLQ